MGLFCAPKDVPRKAAHLVPMLCRGWDVENGHRAPLLLWKAASAAQVNRVLDKVAHSVAQKGRSVVVCDDPNGFATCNGGFQDGAFNSVVVGRDWHKAVVPLHLETEVFCGNRDYSCKVCAHRASVIFPK